MPEQADLAELKLSVATFGTRFDVVLVDPPWEEYARRAPGVDVPTWPWQVRRCQNRQPRHCVDTGRRCLMRGCSAPNPKNGPGGLAGSFEQLGQCVECLACAPVAQCWAVQRALLFSLLLAVIPLQA